MKMKKQKTIIIISLLALTLTVLAVSGFAHAQTYQTVTTFTGASDQTTDYFTIPSSEWRITWSYTPSPAYPDYAAFSVFAYPKGETAIYTTSIYETGSSQTSGVTYVHEGTNDYYLKIGAANLQDYTITIEAQTQTATASPTVPEYPSLLTILALIIALPLILAFAKRHKQK